MRNTEAYIPLPEAFVHRVAGQLSDELPAFLATMELPPVRGMRRNTLKPVSCKAPGELEPVSWEPSGRFLSNDSTAGAVSLHEAGAWYLQEPSAMLPAAVLHAVPGETVLDLCAAPGGKSTQLAAQLQGRGLLICNEPVPSRAKILSRNLERMGVVNALAVSAMPEMLAERWPEAFDAVLVDAPCSGEGMFRRQPDTRLQWREEAPAGCAKRQLDILQHAAGMVRPGGRLVYSTCTYNDTENTGVVYAFLQANPDFSLVPFSLPGIEAPEGFYTCWPHRIAGEGQFASLLMKKGSGSAHITPDQSLPVPDPKQVRLLERFFPSAAWQNLRMLGDTLVSAPQIPDIRGLKVFRCGIHLGRAAGKTWIPDHALALSMNRPTFPCFALNEQEAAAYQTGDVIQTNGDAASGWLLLTHEGLALGWGKASDGVIKNHYPKGLRRY